MQFELKNDFLTACFETSGAELISLKDNATEKEYLWCGDKKFWGRHSPVLFPFVGRVKDNTYRYKGKEYHISQHGFARDMEFVCITRSENEIWFGLEANEETKEKYPFDFRLEIGYRLNGRSLKVLWRVINPDKTEKMYFSIGAHPAFMCPVNDGEKQTDYAIWMNKEHLISNAIDVESGLRLSDTTELTIPESGLLFTEHFFDNGAYIIENSQVQKVSLLTPERKPYITVAFDAPLVGIWSPEKKNAPFVCIEPWYGRCDADDFDGTLEERKWGNELDPEEIFEGFYEITCEA